MLARVANALYWIGRYLERAENVSRLLLVTSEVSVEIEGLDDALAQAQWDELLATVSGTAAPGLEFSPESGLALPYVRMLLLDDANPVSVRHSLGRARENARSIREALTREVFEDLNESHRDLERLRRRGLRDPAAAHDEVARTHRSILTALGSIEHTLSRDQGWTFMKLGEALERTQRTLMVLQAKLPGLVPQGEGRELPLLYARWRGLLRCVASLENYRARHGGDLQPDRVVRFLLLEPTAPRSMLCGVARICGYLERLPRGEAAGEAERVVGRLRAALLYDAERILEKDVAAFCAEAGEQLGVAHETICRQYFPV